MATTNGSLRLLVEKWLGLAPVAPVRATRFSRRRLNQRHSVCVEVMWPAGTLTIFFFLHDDGMWRVFPPEAQRPAMSVL